MDRKATRDLCLHIWEESDAGDQVKESLIVGLDWKAACLVDKWGSKRGQPLIFQGHCPVARVLYQRREEKTTRTLLYRRIYIAQCITQDTMQLRSEIQRRRLSILRR